MDKKYFLVDNSLFINTEPKSLDNIVQALMCMMIQARCLIILSAKDYISNFSIQLNELKIIIIL